MIGSTLKETAVGKCLKKDGAKKNFVRREFCILAPAIEKTHLITGEHEARLVPESFKLMG